MRDCLVVVLGTGAAGLRAALELRRAGLQVVAVSKGAVGASGATLSASFSYCCACPGDPSNPPELFREDLLRSGVAVSDPHLVEFMCRDGHLRLEDLAYLGMPWTRALDGELARAWLPGHSVARAFHVDHRTGKALATVLVQACLLAGVRFHQYQVSLDLVLNERFVAGVVMLDLVSGEATTWRCDAVVIASGGASGIYRLHTNPPGQTGDGMALLLRGGGELTDMEFMQMYPTVLIHPPAAYGVIIPAEHLLAAGARLLNRYGEEFFDRWEEESIGQATRDVLARAIAKEIAAGRATDAGGVYLDARHIAREVEQDRHIRFLRDLGVNLASAPLQVAPGAHYSLGGARVNPPTSCSAVAGVFAAGEVVGGVHGANRLAGCALTETQVFGALAGQETIEYLRHVRDVSARAKHQGTVPGTDPRPPERGESPVWDAICDACTKSSGLQLDELQTTLRDVMQRYASVIRSGSGLERALAHVESLRRAFYGQLALPVHPESWHPELLGAVETANMLEVARAVLASALVRTESRGAHYRDDYPEREGGWDGHNLAVRGDGERLAVLRYDRASGERRQVWP